MKKFACLSDVKRHASLVNFLEAMRKVLRIWKRDHCCGLPPSSLPNFITYGNGILEVKLKQMVSNIKRSMASSFWRSFSTIYQNCSVPADIRPDSNVPENRGCLCLPPPLDS
jgi:hypothetical protein